MTTPLPPNAPLVACVNSSQDLVTFLRDIFVHEGFRAVPYATSLAEGPETLITFLQQLSPQAVVYAVSLPYQKSWAEFEQVRAALPDFHWVVTTTNKRALDELVGPTNTIEIIGKPFDIDLVFDAVRRGLAGRGD